MALHPHLSSIKGYAPAFVAARLAEALALPGRTPVQGVAGLQGTGKSTLCAQMAALASERGLRVVVLSIDDFYLGRRERLALGRRVHPLLATRGPPGSHDVALACRVLDALRAGRDVDLPRFDKLADRRLPPSRWRRWRGRADLVLFEGWFLRVPPEPAAALAHPVNALERDEDPDGRWRHYCNRALAGYAPLWRRLDALTWLRGPGFEVVPRWRWQQEQSLQAANPGRTGMDRAQVRRFVRFFERVSRHALRQWPALADRILPLDARRRPIS